MGCFRIYRRCPQSDGRSGLTQHDVAKRLRRRQRFVKCVRSGDRKIDVVDGLRIARTYQIQLLPSSPIKCDAGI